VQVPWRSLRYAGGGKCASLRAIITTAVEKGCDLIVMASHGRRGVSAIVLGSETLKVLTLPAIQNQPSVNITPEIGCSVAYRVRNMLRPE
jgi:hypothetical protein